MLSPGSSTRPIGQSMEKMDGNAIMPTSGVRGQTAQSTSITRKIVAALIGSALEWYDFSLYGVTAALVFAPLFSLHSLPVAGTLAAFATYAVGFLARPLGGIVFGHYGDRIGRKPVLAATLIVMGVSTCLMGLLPTFDQIGVWAPILLVVLRIIQGLGAGAEYGEQRFCSQSKIRAAAGSTVPLPPRAFSSVSPSRSASSVSPQAS